MSLLDMIRRKVSQQRAQDMSPSPSPPIPPGPRDRQNGEASPTRNSQSAKSLEEDMAQFLPYMPSLLSKDLPPCGLSVQVAYESVNTRLRKRWLYFRGQKSLSEVCQVVKDDLADQSILFPPFSRPSGPLGKSMQRTPWRRETVFFYEVRWIDYFLREAQAPEPMAESEPVERAFHSSVPKELGFRCGRKDVLGMWAAWHAKKRARSPAVPGVDAESALKAGSSRVEKISNGENENSGVLVDSCETEESIQR